MTRTRTEWRQEHTDVLERMCAVGYRNAEIAAWIEHETGRRFSVFTVSRRRAMLGLSKPKPRRLIRHEWRMAA